MLDEYSTDGRTLHSGDPASAAEGPYRIGGYSFGGLVAYEMAQQLEAQGESVALLALFDAYPGKVEIAR